jgi:hypothetical protein
MDGSVVVLVLGVVVTGSPVKFTTSYHSAVSFHVGNESLDEYKTYDSKIRVRLHKMETLDCSV